MAKRNGPPGARKMPLRKGRAPIDKADRKSAYGRIDDKARSTFLDAIFSGFSVGEACKMIGVCRQAIYQHRDKNPEFAAAWIEARDTGHDERCDKIRDELWKRAFEGQIELETRRGRPYKAVKRYDNSLILALARAHMPEEFGRLRVDSNVDVGEGLREWMERVAADPANRVESLIK